MSPTHSIGHDRVTIGEESDGEVTACAVLFHGAGSVTVIGTGRDAVLARAHLAMLLRAVEHDAGAVADQLAFAEFGEGDEA